MNICTVAGTSLEPFTYKQCQATSYQFIMGLYTFQVKHYRIAKLKFRIYYHDISEHTTYGKLKTHHLLKMKVELKSCVRHIFSSGSDKNAHMLFLFISFILFGEVNSG